MYSTVDFRKLQDRLNNIVNEGSMKDTVIKIEDFIEKYSEYYGSNGDTLPQGYVQYALNSGIATDAIENDESEALYKKYGEMMDDNPWQFADEMPITKQMFDEIASITGTDDVEENGEMISGVLDSMEDVYVNEEPNEGNEFSGNRQDAIDKGEDEFEVDGKKYKVTKEDAQIAQELQKLKEMAGIGSGAKSNFGIYPGEEGYKITPRSLVAREMNKLRDIENKK
jgi:hypothetical protein